MRKGFFKIIIILILVLIFQQLYWYIGQAGNLSIFINNQSSIDSVHIELYLDGEKIVNDNFSSNPYNYKNHSFNVTPWRHQVTISTGDDLIKKDYTFYNLLVNRIVIELTDSEIQEMSSLKFNVKSEYIYKRLAIE